MRILFVSLFLPYERAGHAGGRYVFELLRGLSKRHEIDLVARVEEQEDRHLETLRPFCRSIHPYRYRSPWPRTRVDSVKLALNYLGFSRYAQHLIDRGAHDVVQVEWVETGVLMRRSRARMVLDAHDVITKPAMRAWQKSRGVMAGARYLVASTLERYIMRRFDVIATQSDSDREFLIARRPWLDVVAVPHPAGVDISKASYERVGLRVLFLASFRHRPINVEAALHFHRNVFPLIRAAVPDATFMIAGDGPPPVLTDLGRSDPNVQVTGFVEDIDRCYKEAHVFVAPILIGGGVIVKVLDAMAAGTPVVSTSYGNESVRAIPGEHLLVADDAPEFARHVVSLLTDPSLAARIGEAGRRFVSERFTLDVTLETLESIYSRLTSENT
jgi:glycosyltransferase involved in cell wall biosynthesis